MFARYGTWEYSADNDDTQYLAITRIVYQGENSLRHPYAGKWEGQPTQYPGIPFVQTGQFNRFLGLPLMASNLEWRIAGGLMFGAALFLFFRYLFAQTRYPTAWALGCSLICITDGGFVQGRSFILDFTLIPHILNGTTPLTKPDAIPQLRVVSPLLMLPFLLLLATAFLPATRRDWKWMAVGAAAFGMCVHMYFFFWTAALVAIAGYSLSTRRIKFGAAVIAGGLILGAPQLYSTYKLSQEARFQPLLQRLCRGQKLPVSDPYRRMNLRNVWAWGKLLAGAIAILWLRLRGLGFVWWGTFAGFALANSAIATGLEFENWHWNYVQAPMGEILILGATVMLLDRVRRFSLKPLWAFPMALIAIAAVWRPYEALAAPEAQRNNEMLAQLRPLRSTIASLGEGHMLVGPSPAADLALLDCKCGRLYNPYTATSTFISDSDANARYAVNGYLQGQDRDSYSDPRKQGDFTPCSFVNPDWSPAAVAAHRTALFDGFEKGSVDPDLLKIYRPDYLLVPSRVVPDGRAGHWNLLSSTSDWNLWERK